MAKRFIAKGYIVVACEKCSLDFVINAGEVDGSDMKCPQCGTEAPNTKIRQVVSNLLQNARIRSELGEGVDFGDIIIDSQETGSSSTDDVTGDIDDDLDDVPKAESEDFC